MPDVRLLIEGTLDAAVGERLLRDAGFGRVDVFGRKGAAYIRARASGFNRASPSGPVLVLVDFMDAGRPCPGDVVRTWVDGPLKRMAFRVVVREIESWLLADAAGIARFLGVSRTKIPPSPESIPRPKERLIDIARRSRLARVRELIVPRRGSSAIEGPAYSTELARFVREGWDPIVASRRAPSLESCRAAVACLRGA